MTGAVTFLYFPNTLFLLIVDHISTILWRIWFQDYALLFFLKAILSKKVGSQCDLHQEVTNVSGIFIIIMLCNFFMQWNIPFKNCYYIYIYIIATIICYLISKNLEFSSFKICVRNINVWMRYVIIITLFNFLNKVIIIYEYIFFLNE